MAWANFPFPDDAYVHTAASLKKAWARLHVGDAEPLPKNPLLIEAWIAFHAGDFARAARIGLDVGVDGYSVAHKATCIYTTYLNKDERKRIAAFEEVAERCERQQIERPDVASGFYWHAYSLGRFAQGISIVKALSMGIAPRVRRSIEAAIRLAPNHSDAHVALGTFHAEIIGSVGAMIGGLTYGVKKEECYRAYKKAIELNPQSAIARIEYANALVTLDGKKKMDDAVALYTQAANIEAQDAMERLDVEAARNKLEEE
jgi:tetratricopeptide (TPR) repeat protein